jgi:hypothetical protein
MKKLIVILCTLLLLGSLTTANATMIDRGNGLIYDTILNVTWLWDANYAKTAEYQSDGLMTYAEASYFANNLVYKGFSDWRLPSTDEGIIDLSIFAHGYRGPEWDGNYDYKRGYNMVNSEMGSLFYESLMNNGYYDTSGNYGGNIEWGLKNIGLFTNFRNAFYWSGTEYSLDPNFAWVFNFNMGLQTYCGEAAEYYALIIRDGDVIEDDHHHHHSMSFPSTPVPEPTTMLLIGSGLLGLTWFRKRL